MTNKLFIDGIDIFAQYGVFITEDGYKNLLSFPALKSPIVSDWAERDGIEVDLSSPKLDTKSSQISFCVVRNGDLNGFLNLCTNSDYRNIEFRELGLLRKLRFVSCSNFNGSKTSSLILFTIEFADDYPLREYVYALPNSGLITQRGYSIDSIDLSTYGVAILEGSDSEILKPCSAKPNLAINVSYLSGAIYDTTAVIFESKEVKLNCLMLATNLVEFWKNYNALLYDLTREGLRYFGYRGLSYACYYKSSSVSTISLSGTIWCEFNLVLVFTKQGI